MIDILKKEDSVEIKNMPGKYLYLRAREGSTKLISLVDILQRLHMYYIELIVTLA